MAGHKSEKSGQARIGAATDATAQKFVKSLSYDRFVNGPGLHQLLGGLWLDTEFTGYCT